MYSNEDLDSAVKAGIFTEIAVTQFRAYVEKEQSTISVDEEHFRLVSGFNDFFVVIACILMLVSVTWLGSEISNSIGALALAVASWGLSEFFVRKRKMALPAILLLATFIGAAAWLFASFFQHRDPLVLLAVGVTTSGAACFHWLRFQVPITVAAGVASIIISLLAALMALYPEAKQWSNVCFLISGFIVFALAMHWDAQDTKRQTRKSDIAFWLHLLAAPLIVHPIFSILGVFDGQNSAFLALVVISLYILLALISIVIDRRALMVSALTYVLVSFTTLLKTYGFVSLGFALTGLVIGSALLLLSAYWHVSRVHLTKYLPVQFLERLPPLR